MLRWNQHSRSYATAQDTGKQTGSGSITIQAGGTTTSKIKHVKAASESPMIWYQKHERRRRSQLLRVIQLASLDNWLLLLQATPTASHNVSVSLRLWLLHLLVLSYHSLAAIVAPLNTENEIMPQLVPNDSACSAMPTSNQLRNRLQVK